MTPKPLQGKTNQAPPWEPAPVLPDEIAAIKDETRAPAASRPSLDDVDVAVELDDVAMAEVALTPATTPATTSGPTRSDVRTRRPRRVMRKCDPVFFEERLAETRFVNPPVVVIAVIGALLVL